MRTTTKWVALVMGIAPAACGEGTGTLGGGGSIGGGDAQSFQVPLQGPSPPSSADVVVVWGVSSTSPDYSYRFGGGSLAGGRVTVTIPGAAPPSEALNQWDLEGQHAEVGVGAVVLVPAGTVIPEGIVASQPPVLGGSPRSAIIFRRGGIAGHWETNFPEGQLSCGQCLESADGFDTYVPIDCYNFEITTDDSVRGCNWT